MLGRRGCKPAQVHQWCSSSAAHVHQEILLSMSSPRVPVNGHMTSFPCSYFALAGPNLEALAPPV